VCRFTQFTEDALPGKTRTWTRVIRELRWGGAQFQCEIRFGDSESLSERRIEDATAICDSIHIRASSSRRAECPLGSFKPSERRTHLFSPDAKGHPTVAVDIDVPDGYERDDVVGVFGRHDCPDVIVWPVEVHEKFYRLNAQGCRDDTVVIRQEPRGDGSVAICEVPYVKPNSRPDRWYVARRIRWGGREWICDIEFNDWDWIQDDTSATPSKDRFKDAIAVCDSAKLREPTKREKCNVWKPSLEKWIDMCIAGAR
jgi:hypothetical protein